MKRSARLTVSAGGNADGDDASFAHALSVHSSRAHVHCAGRPLIPSDLVAETCAALPGAVLDHPFGLGTDTWKVGGKIFAITTAVGDGVTLKCADPEQAAFLIDIGLARPAPYLKRGGWVLIPRESLENGAIEPADLADRLRASHATVVAGLPRRLRP